MNNMILKSHIRSLKKFAQSLRALKTTCSRWDITWSKASTMFDTQHKNIRPHIHYQPNIISSTRHLEWSESREYNRKLLFIFTVPKNSNPLQQLSVFNTSKYKLIYCAHITSPKINTASSTQCAWFLCLQLLFYWQQKMLMITISETCSSNSIGRRSLLFLCMFWD